MKEQEFSTVWRDGQEWFDFPKANEQGVTDMLMLKGLMQECVILPKGEAPQRVKVVTINPATIANEKLTKEIEELKKQLAQAQSKETVKPTNPKTK